MKKFFCLFLLMVALAGCSGGSGSGGSAGGSGGATLGLASEEPAVVFEPVVARVDPTSSKFQMTGYRLNLSGVDPSGRRYQLNNFVVKGAGLQGIYQAPYGLQQFDYPYMDLLATSGANCIRCYGAAFKEPGGETWDKQVNDIKAALQWATKATTAGHPMYVAVGITMGTSTDLNYTNPQDADVVAQRETIQKFVDGVVALDNSRQIGWFVGNELCTTPGDAQHTATYQEINRIAQYIRQRSNLPTATAVPQVSEHELQLIKAACPDLQVLGVNAYHGFYGSQQGGGALDTLASTMAASAGQSGGWNRPYVVSEFASYNLGAADLPRVTLPNTPAYTPQGYYGLEANSTLMGADYRHSYDTYIKPYLGGTSNCVGSFVYVWQNPVYCSLYAYFYEMFISGPNENIDYNPQGQFRLEAVDSLVKAWGGSDTGPYPQIVLGADNDPQGISCSFKALASNLNPTPVAPGSSQTASVTATFPRPLSFNWYLVEDTGLHYNPQMYQGTKSSALTQVTNNGNTSTVTFKAPATKGNYQLRVTLTDGTSSATQATAATAAVMFVVGP